MKSKIVSITMEVLNIITHIPFFARKVSLGGEKHFSIRNKSEISI